MTPTVRRAVMWLFAVLGAWVVGLELQVIAIPGLRLGPVFGDYSHNVIEVLAGVLCLGGAWQARREQTAWLLIGIGVLAWALGNLYYTVVLYDLEAPPIPSPADVGFLLFPVLARAGVFALVRARTRDVPTALWIDGAIAALAVTARQLRDRLPDRVRERQRQAGRGRHDARLPGLRPHPDRRRRRRALGHRLAPGPHVGPARRRHRDLLAGGLVLSRRVAAGHAAVAAPGTTSAGRSAC